MASQPSVDSLNCTSQKLTLRDWEIGPDATLRFQALVNTGRAGLGSIPVLQQMSNGQHVSPVSMVTIIFIVYSSLFSWKCAPLWHCSHLLSAHPPAITIRNSKRNITILVLHDLAKLCKLLLEVSYVVNLDNKLVRDVSFASTEFASTSFHSAKLLNYETTKMRLFQQQLSLSLLTKLWPSQEDHDQSMQQKRQMK